MHLGILILVCHSLSMTVIVNLIWIYHKLFVSNYLKSNKISLQVIPVGTEFAVFLVRIKKRKRFPELKKS